MDIERYELACVMLSRNGAESVLDRAALRPLELLLLAMLGDGPLHGYRIRQAHSRPDARIEKRLESYENLKKELGSISIVSAETPAANQVVVRTQSSTAVDPKG